MNEIVKIESQDGISVVSFEASSISDSEGISEAREELKSVVESESPRQVVFDFSKVKFFSSQVLGLLLEVRAKLRDKSGGEVVISGIDPQLYRVFRITNLDQVFKFFSDKESAVAAFKI